MAILILKTLCYNENGTETLTIHRKNGILIMSSITLHSAEGCSITMISDIFVDYYMPRANGEFVKIYLYLLRSMHNTGTQISLSMLADVFSCPENDIRRALNYWDDAGVLSLSYKKDELSSVLFLPLEAPKKKPSPSPAREQRTQEEPKTKRTRISQKDILRRKEENAEIAQLLFVCEQYLGRTLSPSETERLFYYYDELHFPVDLVEYLVEYCVSKGSTSIHYIEKVAQEWHKTGINTVEMAKKETTTWHRSYFVIMRAFGIRGRNPIDSEIAFMNKWIKEYDFTIELIQEACSRTVTKTGKQSFEYADKILSDWRNHNVHHLEDIRRLDSAHKAEQEAARQKARAARSDQRGTVPSSPNRFNNFEQRDYDWSQLEKQLLNQQ